MTLKPTPRWMQTALDSAAKASVAMPWQRGARRAEMLARRKGPLPRSRPSGPRWPPADPFRLWGRAFGHDRLPQRPGAATPGRKRMIRSDCGEIRALLP
ncbi:hypothetical protein ACTTAM_03880 [Rhodobacter capsulatus]|uniref:hypothetical protein n=1 Tax=Rhodobacter capsulatus TaxID=1061 RepID=UPI004029BD39